MTRAGIHVAGGPPDVLASGFERAIERLQRPGRGAIFLVEQSQEEVRSPDEVMVEEARLLLCLHEHALPRIGETLEHDFSFPPRRSPARSAKLCPLSAPTPTSKQAPNAGMVSRGSSFSPRPPPLRQPVGLVAAGVDRTCLLRAQTVGRTSIPKRAATSSSRRGTIATGVLHTRRSSSTGAWPKMATDRLSPAGSWRDEYQMPSNPPA